MSLYATDDLGRTMISPEESGAPRSGRCVGMFYYLWMGEHGTGGPYVIPQILAENPDAMEDPDCPGWGPAESFHHWGEPMFGYYLSSDEWVLRRHAQMLTDAQIDVLFFDVTNNYTYKHIYTKLCDILMDLRQQGFPAPAIAFYCRPGEGGGPALEEVYRDVYTPGLYTDLWFYWGEKPLIVANPNTASSDEMREFFTYRSPTWNSPQEPNIWTWCQEHPQVTSCDSDGAKEETSVSICVPTYSMSEGFFDERVIGRSWHDGARDRRPDAVNHGFCFDEQWRHAIKEDPPLVLVTQFNEWMAQRFGAEAFEQLHPVLFRDDFDQEFSRDIEPMKDGHGDNYYIQLCDMVRKYKGAPPPDVATAPCTIDIAGSLEQWSSILPEYREYVGDTTPRNHPGYDNVGQYVNNTGRNEFKVLKATADATHVYFYAQTVAPLTSHEDPNWMQLFIGKEDHPDLGWKGFEYVVNRNVVDTETTMLEQSTGGWTWQTVAPVQYRAEGTEIHLAIARSALGLDMENGPLRLTFKWADNMQEEGDIMDFYINGDSAPRGRFAHLFRYDCKALA